MFSLFPVVLLVQIDERAESIVNPLCSIVVFSILDHVILIHNIVNWAFEFKHDSFCAFRLTFDLFFIKLDQMVSSVDSINQSFGCHLRW